MFVFIITSFFDFLQDYAAYAKKSKIQNRMQATAGRFVANDGSNKCSANVRQANDPQCGLPGEAVANNSSSCCSKAAYENKICLGSKGFLADNYVVCLNSDECKSNSCDLSNKICWPSESNPSHVGCGCYNNYECKSRNCSTALHICMGSSSDPASYGDICQNSYECKSGACVPTRDNQGNIYNSKCQ